jgi:hypothetical protein
MSGLSGKPDTRKHSGNVGCLLLKKEDFKLHIGRISMIGKSQGRINSGPEARDSGARFFSLTLAEM